MNNIHRQQIEHMLQEEGIPHMYMHHSHPSTETVVMTKDGSAVGFYTWNKQHDSSALIHFCVDKKLRSNDLARSLAKHFRFKMMDEGIRRVLVCIPPGKIALFKFLKYFFRNPQIYDVNDRGAFVQMEVK